MNQFLLQDFQNPNTRSRIAPFWFWNCGMEEDKVRRQVRQMVQEGCGGFFIHPRQGLSLPYLSKQWFARIRVAVEEAQKCGIEAWLYDEYPYPSGIAGGFVTANHPEFRERVINHFDFKVASLESIRREFPLGRLVCALAYPIENGEVNWNDARDIREEFGVVLTRDQFLYWPMGHIPTNEKRFLSDEGRLVLEWQAPEGEWQIWIGIEREHRGFKYYDCFFDPLHIGAAEEFLRLTHERYKAELGGFFGTTIPGIFTDETAPPDWSPEIEKALDIDLSLLLPALKRDDHPESANVRLAFRECALRLFRERWEAPIGKWCRENGLIWGAEKAIWRPSQFWNVAEPSTDAGHRRIPAPPEELTADLRANHRAAMSAAEQNGGEEVRCECFHSLGWGATLQDQKWSIDWLCVQGVNRFTPHAFYATSSGLTKHDAAPSFFAENPYWQHFKPLAEYTARLCAAMSAGREKARLALLHPTEEIWKGGKEAQRAQMAFNTLQNELLAQNIQFHIVDSEALLKATANNGGLELGRARYELVATPLESSFLDSALTKAREAGLTILDVSTPESWDAYRPLNVRDEKGEEIPTLWSLWRETENQELIFFSNTSAESVSAKVEIHSNAKTWENWSLESGEATLITTQCDADISCLTLDLPPFGSALIVGSNEEVTSGIASLDAGKIAVLPLEGEWDLKLAQSNALRLNQWKAISSNDDNSSPDCNDASWKSVEAMPLRYNDQRGSAENRGWRDIIAHQVGDTIWYRRNIQADFVPENLDILIEDGAILGDWTLYINGEAIPSTAFVKRVFHGEDKSAAPIARFFREGENTLALKVENVPEMGGLRTPIHLVGEFALGGTTGRVLQKLPTKSSFNDLAGAGLPHFSGSATYRKTINIGDSRLIELPMPFAEVAEIRIAGQSLGVRSWSPYQWNIPSHISGEVDLEITITNTLLPFVEGQQWDATKGVAFSV
jgi:hypothetical protein